MIKNLVAGMFVCLCMVACEEPDLVSSDVIPGTDQPGIFSDSMEVTAFTTTDKELESGNTSSPMFIGTINDLEIGSTTASFYIQMLLGASSPLAIPSTGVADSMVIALAYSGIYGDSSATHTVSVYQLAQSLASDSAHHTTDTFNLVDPASPLGTVTLVPALNDSVLIDGISKAPQLRIPLNPAVANTFLNEIKNNSSSFLNNSALLDYFKGLYIKSTTDFNGQGDVKGSIIAFNSGSSINTVTLYYKDTDTSSVQKSYSFQLGVNSVRSNLIKQTYNAGIINDSLQTPPLLYVQSLNGLRVKIKFPGVMALASQGSVSINKAEIVVRIKEGSDKVIKPHSGLFIFNDTPSGAYALVTDYDESSNIVGGFLDGDTYRLNISQQMQRIVNGSANDYVYLALIGRGVNAQRTILQGAGSIKLNLTYTKNN
jgi:hypothetical protein